jgi:sialate O-acetylesterase
MYKHHRYLWLTIFLAALLSGCSWLTAPAKHVKLVSLFSDNMVLQRDKPLPVWGTADPGGEVTVRIQQQSKKTKVSDNGTWQVTLDPMPAGGPHELQVIGRETVTLKNVMIGEVWVCSGQSNMEMPVAGWGRVLDYRKEIATADYPNIRLYQVKHTISKTPLDTVNCPGWSACSPETVPEFSAAAYFFGRMLYSELQIPIGLVHTSWGGTVAEAWTSGPALKTMPYFVQKIAEMESTRTYTMAEYESAMAARKIKIGQGDAGYKNGQPVWNDPQVDLTDWQTMQLPTKWEVAGYPGLDGIMWFRKDIVIPESMLSSDVTLHLGPINDIDVTWFNGEQVGSISDANAHRIYPLAKSLIHSGKNSIVVRVEDIGNVGGLWAEPEQMFLAGGNGQKIPLAGEWRCKIGFDTQTLGPQPQSPDNPNQPSVLFNAMLHPLMPYAIRGAIWYQGESNASRANQYRTLFPLMIKDWRANWQQGDFPFLFVQLANFQKKQTRPEQDSWAELREAQLQTLALPNTGMAITIDIGEVEDIHPKNKQEVGRRLALNALHLVYGKEIEYSGPIYTSMQVEGNKIRLHFDHVAQGLVAKDSNELKGFTICGEDKKFVWATAKIDGETIVVSSPVVAHPVAVRYAWAFNPIANLYNKAGLPASPFRTDTWPGTTL